jgi:hypothetical protein
MRRLAALAALAALTALAGCSPAQEAAWRRWFHREPRAAVAWAVNECGALCSDDWDGDGVVEPEPSSSDGDVPDEVYTGALSGMAQCGQWADEAWAAGWRDEGYTLGRIMYAESRCDPGAYNPQAHFGGHATGLMQIIDPTWPNHATACQGGLYDPVVNLRCALYLRNTYGWGQWVTY